MYIYSKPEKPNFRKMRSLYTLLHKTRSLYPHYYPSPVPKFSTNYTFHPAIKLWSTLASNNNNNNNNNNNKQRCWKCNCVPKTSPFLSCESCRSVQPLDPSLDYFRIFGLEKKYDIEVINLEGKYKDWQKKLHPDLVHSKSEREKEYAAQQSSRVIDAYRTLSNPLARAIYVLKLEGVDVDEEQTVSDPEMLAEILEIREAVEEAADPQALNQIQTQTQKKLNHWSESFANAFRSKQFEEAQTSIQRMTYYKRVNEEIVKKL